MKMLCETFIKNAWYHDFKSNFSPSHFVSVMGKNPWQSKDEVEKRPKLEIPLLTPGAVVQVSASLGKQENSKVWS